MPIAPNSVQSYQNICNFATKNEKNCFFLCFSLSFQKKAVPLQSLFDNLVSYQPQDG